MQALEPGHHAKGAVENAALGHGVDVRARQHDGRGGTDPIGAKRAEDVAGGIDPRREPGRFQLAEQPRARLFVRRTPAHARHAAAGQRAEAGECGEAFSEPCERD